MFNQLLNFIIEGNKKWLVSDEVEVEEPIVAPDKKTDKPISPLKPTPGIVTKPKALNKDAELFLRRRKSV